MTASFNLGVVLLFELSVRSEFTMNGGDRPPAQPWMIASQAGSSLVGPVVLGVILDAQLGWTPWATLVGIVLGLLGCVGLLILAKNRSGS